MQSMVLTTRALVSGEMREAGHRFAVPEKEAKLWSAIGKAKAAGSKQEAPQMSQSIESGAEASEIDALRADYKAKTGQDADRRWSVGRLKSELQRGGGTYGRRDMRAES